MANWARLNRTDDMWALSPAQVRVVFEAHGMTRRKGSARDLAAFARQHEALDGG